MAKLSSLEKYADPGSAVTVCFPALMRSGSTSSSVGKGPSPRIPADADIGQINLVHNETGQKSQIKH